jgi:hypothetical protein
MFEMQHVCADGVTRTLGMAFDGDPYHRGNGVFMTKSGSMISKRDWPKLKRAMDERIKPFNGDLIRMKDTPEAFDDEGPPGTKALRRYLHENTGLSWDVIEEACELCELAAKERGEVADALPVAGARHALSPRGAGTLIKKVRELGQKPGLPAEDHATRFAKRYPEAERVAGSLGSGSYGRSQFADPGPLTAADRKKLAYDRAGGRGRGILKDLGINIDRVEVGDWPQRKW